MAPTCSGGCRLQAASTPELPKWSDLPDGVAARFLGKTGRHLMQVYSKANIGKWGRWASSFATSARSMPRHRQSVAGLRGVAADEAELRAGCVLCLLAIVPLVLLDFRD